jgi:hypothetical protein
MKAFILFFVGCLLLSAHSLIAEDPSFLVTIVGYRQKQNHDFHSDQADHDKGCPFIKVPSQASSVVHVGPDEATGNHFYVLVRNVSKSSIRLNLKDSDWYDCLVFHLINPDGKSFEIRRPPTAWAANGVDSWIFQPDDLRVLTVDFTSGRWQGLPPAGELSFRAQFKIKATFSYYDWDIKKRRSYDSPDTLAENGP